MIGKKVLSFGLAAVLGGALASATIAGGLPGAPALTGSVFDAAAPVLRVAQADDEMLAAMMSEGEPIYQDFCSACHGTSGRGDVGPGLVGNGRLADPAFVYRQIAQGGSEMPGFDGVLSEEELLAVGHYVMNAWGNEYGPLTAETAGIAE
ncbi:cytochrome c [Arsenicitalea aurantiaca]|uniref:Cytochrome c n=1 Tax=Arsenicitalea aurantiaca TaxID=1783274 RepID=A0A433XFD6_9HYPH|nr:cytochrome c [Arsenicitalea aurantiaca]RUT32770.1 cytochrome c [Arsenicitalea aurantiaca]